jgi:hypothetical protein
MLASLCNLPSSPAGAPQPSSKPLCLGCCLCSPGSLNTRSKTTSSLTCWVDSVEGVSRCHKVRVPSAGPNWSLPPVLSPSPPPTPGNQMLSRAKPHSFFFFFFPPAGMAFALLANLPAVNGLYSSFFPLLTYFFLGGIHQMVPGKVSPLWQAQ